MSSSPSVVGIDTPPRMYASPEVECRSTSPSPGRCPAFWAGVAKPLLPQRSSQLSTQQRICGSVKYYSHETDGMSTKRNIICDRARTSRRPYYDTLKHIARLVHSRGDGLSSPCRALQFDRFLLHANLLFDCHYTLCVLCLFCGLSSHCEPLAVVPLYAAPPLIA